MTPLFYAVFHGCQADRHVEARRNVHQDRIRRGNKAYLTRNLGAFGANLPLLANFFELPWSKPVATLSPDNQTWLIAQAAFTLRALGRLADAIEPMREGAERRERQEAWANAAIGYGNLSELQLAVGEVKEAIANARKGVDLADRSGDADMKAVHRTTLAASLHRSGALKESARQFEEAERLQTEDRPEYAMLGSVQGYRYCDLLLSLGQTADVLRRAAQTLRRAETEHRLLDIGLDHLSLGRANPSGSAESAVHLDQVIDYIRRSGVLDYLPRALLARGTQGDLDKVYAIATRSGMRRHLTDYHLARARLYLREGRTEKAREHMDQAATLIEQTGYHLRDAELDLLKLTAQSASAQ
jgi:tetratricopeptide (TPR) repeat protein